MQTSRIRPFAASLLLIPSLLLAACGGSSSTPSDTTAPTVAIVSSAAGTTATGNVTFTFTFSEDVGTSFVVGDVGLTGGTKVTFTRVSATSYTLLVAPTVNTLGSLAVSVPVGTFADVAGNLNNVAGSATQAYDTRLAQMSLPVSFDSASVNYGLLGFGGAEDSTIVVDPAGGTNKVAKVVKSATAETWAGTTLTADGTLGFAPKIQFDATNTRMTVRVYSPNAGIQVRLKVEDHTNNGISVETEATTTLVNTWETLTFDFASQAAGTAALNVANTYDKASIFFNFGVAGATAGAKTYYFDDVTFIGGGGIGGGGGPVAFSDVTFDSATVTYTLTGFGGAEDSTVVVDPVVGTNHAVKVVKSATAEVWAGTTFSTLAGAKVGVIPLDATNTRMTVRVYSPDAGIQVRLKLENAANGGITVETEATTTLVNTWETLTFDFANQVAGTAALNVANTYDKASIFFNFGVTGATAGAKTYYFDDVNFIGGGGIGGGGGGAGAFSDVTFDSATVTYTLTDFGGTTSSQVVDPTGGTNMVAKVIKTNTAETWAGTTVSTGVNQSVGRIAFTATRQKMSVKVYSPNSGIPVRLKVEDPADPTKSVETEALTTLVNTWETLTFDFAVQAAGTAAINLGYTYAKASIFFNFGVTGATAGEKTYYFDDVAFVP